METTDLIMPGMNEQRIFGVSFLNKLCLLTIILCSILLCSCHKDTPKFTNCAISGYGRVDQGLESDINIVANGPFNKVVASTDENGHYFIGGLGEGTYVLTYNKTGYGEKKESVRLLGSDTAYLVVNLYKKYDVPIPLLSNVHIEYNQRFGQDPVLVIVTNLRLDGTALPRVPVILYLNNQADVSYKNSSAVYASLETAYDDDYNIVFLLRFNYLTGFASGSTVYFRAYVANPREYIENLFYGLDQFSTFYPDRYSDVMSFTVP